MVAVKKLRIKFGSEESLRVFQKVAVTHVCEENRTDQPSVNCSSKRVPGDLDQGQTRKKQKMDNSVLRQCSVLLRSVVKHPHGWIFNEPVDPIRLNIPDYFTVISKPMDLSSIQCKLVKNVYNSCEEFAADVRLTFSNAMLYNPPGNVVHKMAKELNEFFELRWKSHERKCNSQVSKPVVEDSGVHVREASSTPAFPDLSSKKVKEKTRKVSLLSNPLEEKAGKASLSVRPTPPLVRKLKLKKSDSSHLGTRIIDDNMSKVANGGPTFGASKCGSCGKITCVCFTTSAPSERHCRDNRSEVSSITDCHPKSISSTKLNPPSDESVSSKNEDSCCRNEKPSNSDSSDKDSKTMITDVPLSPRKALRAAMLKSRFADTILKAKQRKIFDHGNNSADTFKLEKEKEQLKREERARMEAERERLEAEIKAAEAEAVRKKDMELKMERERQRLALQKMEEARKEEEENAWRVEREMKKLFGSDMKECPRVLPRLGLFFKQDHHHDDDDDDDDGDHDLRSSSALIALDFEEGEIS